jgi:hypothetical protein
MLFDQFWAVEVRQSLRRSGCRPAFCRSALVNSKIWLAVSPWGAEVVLVGDGEVRGCGAGVGDILSEGRDVVPVGRGDGVATREFVTSAGRLDVEVAGVDLEVAGVDVEVAGVDLEAAGVDVEVAGVDLEVAGVDSALVGRGDSDRRRFAESFERRDGPRSPVYSDFVVYLEDLSFCLVRSSARFDRVSTRFSERSVRSSKRSSVRFVRSSKRSSVRFVRSSKRSSVRFERSSERFVRSFKRSAVRFERSSERPDDSSESVEFCEYLLSQ